MLDPSIQQREREEKEKEAKHMEQKIQEKRKEITNQMVSDAIIKDKEAAEKEVVLAMDSDANLLSSSSDEDIVMEENKTEGDLSVK